MNIPGETLRVTKPLRCTSLHQSILAESPAISVSFTGESPLQSSGHDSNDEASPHSDTSSDDESMQSDSALGSTLGDAKPDGKSYLDQRRNSAMMEKRQRRASSGTSRKIRSKGLSLSYTSPTTTAHAINEVFTRRDNVIKSPEADRASFLAELPDAIARARKVHYRRDALLPKTMSFNRVQNSLKEESTPFESDIKKEATLAKILKEKATGGRQDDTIMDNFDKVWSSTSDRQSTDGHGSGSKSSSPDTTTNTTLKPSFLDAGAGMHSEDREETLFPMEDLFQTPATDSTTTTSQHANKTVRSSPGKSRETGPTPDTQSNRKTQTRSSRTSKRKMDDGRYEPYSTTAKRRAISPSPASPLGSPMGKGSIFRIEDLTL